MRISMLLFLLVPFVGFAQPVTSLQHQQTADSLVSYFLSQKIFQRHVSLDREQSHSSGKNTFFQYNFRHPRFSGQTFIIAFTLDSTGRFISGNETRGIIKIDSLEDTKWVDASEALAISRNEGTIKKNTIRLVWENTSASYDAYLKTGNLNDIFPGNLVWQVDGKVKFRGDRYPGTFEVDVFTGRVFRRFAIPWD